MPNKNKCEELLNAPEPVSENAPVAVCVFDLNNLRTINNNLGHDKGDEYIRSFAQQLRLAVPEEHFVGRDGGDEFLALLHGLNHEETNTCLRQVRESIAKYSEKNPEMPISYAVGYALSTDFEGTTMRELFRLADKNMYVDKNRAKMEEAAEVQRQNYQLLDEIKGKAISLQIVFIVMRCWMNTACFAPVPHFSWRRMAVIPAQWSRSYRNYLIMKPEKSFGKICSCPV